MKSFTACFFLILFFQTLLAQSIFNENHIIDFGLPYGSSYKLAMGDIDNDGIIDVLAYTSSKVYLYKGLGYGQFSDQETLFNAGGEITLIDSDNDEDLDLFRSKGSIMYEYINDGQGNFSSPTNIYNGGSWSALICGDVDNDGDVDLVKRKKNTDNIPWARLYYIKNLGNNNFADEIEFYLVTGYWDANVHVSFSDLFDTGNLDVVISDYSLGYEGYPDMELHVGKKNGNSFSTTYCADLFLYGYSNPADLDGDGKKELLMYESDTWDLGIYKLQNNGNSFGGKEWITNGNKLLLAFDINNDYMSDLVIIKDGLLKWCKNTNGSFSNNYNIMNFQPDDDYQFFQEDVNGDGYSDILYTKSTQIGWISNLPSTMFFYEENLCDNDSLYFGGQWITEEGVFQDSLTAISGMDSIVNLTVTVLPAPNDFEIHGANEVLQNSTEAYTAPVDNEINYEWMVEGGDITTNPLDNAITVLWSDAGSGMVSAIAKYNNSCQSTSVLNVTNINAINDISISDISIGPVPVQNQLFINTDKELQMTIYNQIGKELINTNKKRIDISGLKDGIYFILLKDMDEGVMYQKKFIKKS